MCRSRREHSNEYLLDEIGVDTAENEPLASLLMSWNRWGPGPWPAARAPGGGALAAVVGRREARRPDARRAEMAETGALPMFCQSFGKKIRSFSDVAAPIFPSKYAFCGVFPHLQLHYVAK